MIHLDILPNLTLLSLNAFTQQSDSSLEALPAVTFDSPVGMDSHPIDVNLSSMTVLTTRQDMLDELFAENGALEQASRVARGFARGKNRRKDEQFVDECEAEATFIVTSIIFTNLRGVLEKFPLVEDRLKFYRMSTGFGLKAYFAHRHTGTISYLKKRGIDEKFIPMHAVDFARTTSEIDMFIAIDAAIRNEVERQVVDFYSIGLSYAEIGEKLEYSPLKVKNILKRVKKRLKADLPIRIGKRTRHRTTWYEGERTVMKSKEDKAFEELCK